MISDAGFQGEITSISTAAQQIEVFSRILKTSVGQYSESNDDDRQKHIQECAVSRHDHLNVAIWKLLLMLCQILPADDLSWATYFRVQ